MADTLWFRIPYGSREGQIALRGWMLTAIGSGPYGHESGMASVGVCPRCFVLVLTEPPFHDSNIPKHEQWHAETDYPIPAELL